MGKVAGKGEGVWVERVRGATRIFARGGGNI